MMPKQHGSIKYQSKETQQEPQQSTKNTPSAISEQNSTCLSELTEGQGNPMRKRLMMGLWGTYWEG